MADKDFIEYENGVERRIKLAVTLTNIANHLKTLNSRQGTCDTDREELHNIAEGTRTDIKTHVILHKDREGRGRFTFGRITTVVGLILAAAGILVSYLFVTTAYSSKMETLSFVEKPLKNARGRIK